MTRSVTCCRTRASRCRSHDEVAPAVDQPVNDGTTIAVRYGKPLELDVDGDTTTYWVTATDVRGALQQIDRSFDRAHLSVSRGAGITRDGLRITVATPKRLTFVLGGKHPLHKTMPACTVKQALQALHVKLGKHDVVRPGLHHVLDDGDKLVLTGSGSCAARRGEPISTRTSPTTTPRCSRVTARSSAPATRGRAT